MHSLRDFRAWFPIVCFVSGLLLPLAVYSLTLAPDLTWAHNGNDGGDLIVAAYSLGVAHPPGYPAYTLLAYFFTLIPLGNIAFRVNILSAVGAAVAAGCVALAVLTLSSVKRKWDNFLGGMVAAWELAFMPFLWGQAVIAEVYAVQAAFVAMTVLLAMYLKKHPITWVAFLLGFIWGITFGIHLNSIFLLPVIIWGLSKHIEKKKSLHLWVGLLTGFSMAFLQWLYIVLRAGRGAVTWGNPTNMDGWLWHLSGQIYRGYVFSFPLESWLSRLNYLAATLLTGLGPIAVFLGLVGWMYLVRRYSGFALALGITSITYVVFAIGYNTTDSDNYTIPALIIFCVAIGCGVIYSINDLRLRFGTHSLIIGWIIIFFMLGLGVLTHWSKMSLRSDHDAIIFGEKIMQAAPASAVLLTDEDRATFSLWYFRYVLGIRSDTIIMDKGLLEYDWYQAQVGLTPEEAEIIIKRNELLSFRPMCLVSIRDQSPVIDCQPGH